MGITTSCSYLFNLFIALIAPVMFEDIGWRTYVFFTCMCLVMALVIHLFYPETKVHGSNHSDTGSFSYSLFIGTFIRRDPIDI